MSLGTLAQLSSPAPLQTAAQLTATTRLLDAQERGHKRASLRLVTWADMSPEQALLLRAQALVSSLRNKVPYEAAALPLHWRRRMAAQTEV